MATIATRLGFNIHSTYNGTGAAQATRSLIQVRTAAQALGTNMDRASSAMGIATTAAVALAPALIPIGSAAAAAGAATVAMAVSSGTALGAYGVAMFGAIQRTLQMAEAGERLAPSQRAFVTSVDGMKAAWERFIVATQPQTLAAATVAVQGITAGIGRLKPLVDAVHPSIMAVAVAFRSWMQGSGLQQFINTVIQHGVPALNALINAGRNVLAVLGIAFRTLAPEGTRLAQALERGSIALRQWAEAGGFQRWLDNVRQNAPQVRAFFDALGPALRNIFTAMSGLAPVSLQLATALLRIVAALPPGLIQAMVVAWVAWRTAMLGMFIIQTLVAIFANLRTIIIALRTAWLLLNASFIASPIGLLIVGITALVAAIVFLATQTQFFQTVWNAVWGAIRTASLAIWNAMQVAWTAFVNAIVVVWQAVSGALVAAWNAVWTGMQVVASAIWTALTAAWSAFINGLAVVWNAVSAALQAAWSAVWNAMSVVASALWTAMTTAWSAFINGLSVVWNAVSVALQATWSAVWTAMSVVAQALWTAMTAAWSVFITGLSAVWTAVSAALQATWSAVWTAMSTVAQAIWAAMGAAWSAFVATFQAVWGAFSAAFSAAWSALWTGVQAIATAVWAALQAAWSAFTGAFTAVFNAFITFMGQAWGVFWQNMQAFALAIWGALQAAWQGFVNFMGAIWGAFSAFLGAAWGAFWEAIRAFAQFIWDTLSQMWVSWTNFISSIWGAFSAFLGAAWGAFWEAIRAFAQFIWDTLSQMWVSWTNFISSIWQAFSAFLGAAWGAFWEAIRAFADFIWNTLSQMWVAWTNFIMAIWTGFSSALGAAWGAFWEAIRAFGQFVWDTMSAAWNGFLNLVRSIYDFFAQSLGDAWGAFWNNILSFARFIWDEIIGVVRGAVNAVIGIINALIGGFNNVAGFLNIGVNISPIPNLNNGGVIGDGSFNVPNFRKGGTVGGYSPGRDTVPAMLSPGEGVLTPEAVRGLGGPGFVNSANRHWAGHRGAGRGARGLGSFEGGMGFATGGMVPGGKSLPVGAIQAMAMGGITLAALARAGLAGVSIIQPEYNVGVAASAGTHDRGGAIDLPADPGILAALLATGEWAAWMRGNGDGMSPHIHAIFMGHPDLSAGAAAQVQDFLAGGDGLGVGGGGGGGNPLAGFFSSFVSHLGEILLNVAQGLNPIAGISGLPSLGGGGGGILGAIGDTIGNIVDVVTGGGSDGPLGGVIDFASSVIDDLLGGLMGLMRPYLLSAVTRPILDTAFSFLDWAVPDGLGGGAGEIALGMGRKLMDDVVKQFILGKAASAPKLPMGGGGAFGDPASVQQWAGLAAEALARAGINPNQLTAFLALMAQESGGNPLAINTTDINAQNGIPSQGLMQVIPPTFAAFRDPSLPNNILDPLANMVAAARYIMSRYGGIVPGSPYAMGTNNARRGWHLVGEQGPEMVHFRGGESVFNARSSERMLRGLRGGGGTVFEKGAFQIDARGATVDAVREMENNLVPKLRQAVQAGVGRR